MEERDVPGRRASTFWRIVGLTVVVLLATVILAVAVAYAAGAVDVSVREKKPGGDRIHLILPALPIELCLRLIPRAQFSHVHSQLQQWLPAIKAASEELERCPDATLVEVHDREDNVTIMKRGAYLIVNVDSRDETVHVSVPLHVLTAAAHAVDSAPQEPPN